jgi:phosphatidate cytidylyltransferase
LIVPHLNRRYSIITIEIADMAAALADPQPKNSQWSDLLTRTLVGVVLAALAFTCVVFGGWPFRLLVVLAGALILLEWYDMTHVSPWALRVVGVALFLGICAASIWNSAFMQGSVMVIAVLSAAIMLLSYIFKQRGLYWGGLGFAYAMLPCVALLYLRDVPLLGSKIVLWVIALVVATDTGAYFAGRIIGGPKLLPSVSPKKTWAGLLGGMSCAALVGYAFAHYTPGYNPFIIAGVSALLAIVSQGGDLTESALKRAFGVKDSGHILPGHGGVMDRLDGLAFVAPIVGMIWWASRIL